MTLTCLHVKLLTCMKIYTHSNIPSKKIIDELRQEIKFCLSGIYLHDVIQLQKLGIIDTQLQEFMHRALQKRSNFDSVYRDIGFDDFLMRDNRYRDDVSFPNLSQYVWHVVLSSYKVGNIGCTETLILTTLQLVRHSHQPSKLIDLWDEICDNLLWTSRSEKETKSKHLCYHVFRPIGLTGYLEYYNGKLLNGMNIKTLFFRQEHETMI